MSTTHWQQYLLERERLLATSRTISVSEMAVTLAHELNQPLGTISNILAGADHHLSLLDAAMASKVITTNTANTSTTAELREMLALAADQARYAARIIARIRDFTRTREPDYTRVDVNQLIEHSVHLFDWAFVAEGVQVECIAAPTELPVWADYTMLQQVVINLFRNALDAMREPTGRARELQLMTWLTTEGVQIDCADTGHGLSSEASGDLYTPFRTDKPEGMGIGLNICRSFVELHRGKLWLTPNDHGGCTAHVLLPLLEPGRLAS